MLQDHITVIKGNIGSGTGLVPDGTKPVLELMLTKFCDAV